MNSETWVGGKRVPPASSTIEGTWGFGVVREATWDHVEYVRLNLGCDWRPVMEESLTVDLGRPQIRVAPWAELLCD